jgi:chromosome segregation ATPase
MNQDLGEIKLILEILAALVTVAIPVAGVLIGYIRKQVKAEQDKTATRDELANHKKDIGELRTDFSELKVGALGISEQVEAVKTQISNVATEAAALKTEVATVRDSQIRHAGKLDVLLADNEVTRAQVRTVVAKSEEMTTYVSKLGVDIVRALGGVKITPRKVSKAPESEG